MEHAIDYEPTRIWAKFSDLEAGDTIDLHGFDCASGTVTVEQDIWGDLFFPCAQGKHFVIGQLDEIGHLIGITITPSATIIPITQERTTMDINTDDANSVSRFFQSIADKVVLASTLPAEVAELRKVVEALKADVESYREHNARMDEEITNLRRERQALQDENASLRAESDTNMRNYRVAEERWNQACQERDGWHNSYITVSDTLETTKRERDDAQMKIMELEDKINQFTESNRYLFEENERLIGRLNSIRSALA